MQNTQKSLLSRFQGAFVGMSAAHEARGGAFHPTDALSNTFRNYGLLVGASVDSIIHCRDVQLADWLTATSRLITDDQMAIAILPIAIYLHEDLPRLQSIIQEIGEIHDLDDDSVASMMFLASSMAYLLTERCQPTNFIPQVLASWPVDDSLVVKQLQLVHQQVMVDVVPTNITQLIGAIALAQQPYLMPIAMATYCFICNPTNLRLATQRAVHIPQQSPLTLALTGILVGAAQGMDAIPPSWYISDIANTEVLMPLAARLLATWAGVYPVGMRLPDNSQAIAAPGVIQKRPGK
jgi:ADP-ribosylglycohydrolase